VKRAKGKFPDIERALSNWVRNNQKKGLPLTDAAIKEKARFFATTVGNNESHLKTSSASWLEKFKQKNGIGGAKLTRRDILLLKPQTEYRQHRPVPFRLLRLYLRLKVTMTLRVTV
jgi:hypothetical protein